jgi:MFS family permease
MGVYTLHACCLRQLVQAYGSQILSRHGRSNVSLDNNELGIWLKLNISSVTPAFILISSAWYARRDQPLRMGIWFSFNGIAQILGGLLSYGLGHIHSSIASWKWMFIVTGALSIIWSGILWFFLPEHQGKARFLDEQEKRASLEMVRSNHTGIHNNKFKSKQLVEALTDVKTWTFAFMAFVWNIPNSIATVRAF